MSNTNKFLEKPNRIHLPKEEISVFDKSSNMFPLGGYGMEKLYHIRPEDLSRSARFAPSPP